LVEAAAPPSLPECRSRSGPLTSMLAEIMPRIPYVKHGTCGASSLKCTAMDVNTSLCCAAPHLLAHPEGVGDDDQLRALKPVQVGLHRLLEALRTRFSTD